jgi:cell shape-determining protein MreC
MKQTKKQIEADLRNKICKQYTSHIDNLQKRIYELSDKLHNEIKKNIEVQTKMEELEEKVRQYEDWNRRLQEFMDMNEEDRKAALAEAKFHEDLKDMVDMYKRFTGMIFH